MALQCMTIVSLLLVLFLGTKSEDNGKGKEEGETEVAQAPNFIIILMDDQDLLLGSPSYMPNLQSKIVSNGMTFTNAFVNTPVCCPSRTELMTGRYFHNVGAPSGDCMHVDPKGLFFNDNPQTLFKLLNSNGYHTGLFGKVTNADGSYYCGNKNNNYNLTQAGISRVYTQCDTEDFYCNKYYNKTENDVNYYNLTNSFVYVNTSDASSYQTSQLGNASLEWIESKLSLNEQFFAYIGVHCPHVPYTPPAWFENEFNNVSLPITPNWNMTFNDTTTVQIPFVTNNPYIHETQLESMTQIYRDRLRASLQVDVIIDELNDILNKYPKNGLNNTYIIYTSDHGYKIGQWNLVCEKSFFYDFDLRVPLYIRGPNVAKQEKNDLIIGNIDIMPTLLDLAGIDIPSIVDGKSFKQSLISFSPQNKNVSQNIKNDGKNIREEWRDVFLAEYIAHGNQYFNICQTWYPSTSTFRGHYKDPNSIDSESGKTIVVDYGVNFNPGNTWRALRILNETHNWSYVEYINYTFTDNDKENPNLQLLYDLTSDEYQMFNIYNQQSNAIQKELHQMLMTYGNCTGASCP